MERRVQLQNSKQKSEVHTEENFPPGKVTESSSLQSGSATIGNQVATRTQSKVCGSSAPLTPEPSFTACDKIPSNDEIPRKRIKTLLPVRSKACSSPPIKRRRTTISTDPEEIQIKAEALPNDNILDDLINQAVKEGAIINLTDTNLPSDHIIETKVVLEPCPLPVSSAKTLAEKESTSLLEPPPIIAETLNVLEAPIHPEHKRIQEYLTLKPPPRESVHLKKEAILTTSEPYLTHVGESLSQPEVLNNQAQVEVCEKNSIDFYTNI